MIEQGKQAAGQGTERAAKQAVERDPEGEIRLLTSLIMDPQWSDESIADIPEDTPFGRLCRNLAEIRAHVQALSRGKLDRGNKARGFIAGSLKETEANLRHLTWQMERVSQGDYSQSVAFMGDFSRAFNKMSREMHNRSEELSRLLERYRLSTDEDMLTGLLNRRTFLEQALSELRRAKEARTPFCLALADIDLFRNINNHFGHANGDRVLQLFASRLRETARLEDLCCRFGGDKFLVFMPGAGREEGARLAERLWRSCTLDTQSGLTVTASFGVSFVDVPELLASFHAVTALEHAIQLANRRLAQAKREGRNRICSP